MQKPNLTTARTQNLSQQARQLNDGHRRLLSLASQQHAGDILEAAESIIYRHIPEDNPTLGPLKEALELEREQAAKGYTIALFGRTGVGKSTLAAILTNSNEPVIGKGAQRTTRETQEYRWENLVVLDTPGIGAANRAGKADEEKALAAADRADLVIFIATDDAPQDTEARFLAELDRHGKTLIALMNCKQTISTADDVEEFLSHPEEVFNQKDTQDRQTQFAELTAKHTSRPTPEFHPTHLQAALIAQQEADSETALRLAEASQLNPTLEVIKTAATLRAKTSALKTPIDFLLPKVQEFGRDFMQASHQAATIHQIFVKQAEANRTWLPNFKKSSQADITKFINTQISPLRQSIATFAETYAESKDVDREWRRRVEQHTKPAAAEAVAKKWHQALNRRAETIQQNLEADLNFYELETDFTFVNKGKIFDWKRFFKWTSGLGSAAGLGALGGASMLGLITLTGPVGWIIGGAIAAIGIIGGFFGGKSKKDRIAERAAKIRSALTENLNHLAEEHERNLVKVLDNLCQQFEKISSEALIERQSLLQKHQNAYQGTGQELRHLVTDSHHQLANNLLNLTANGANNTSLPSIGRVPGQISILMAQEATTVNPDQLKAIAQQLDEPVVVIDQTNGPAEIIRRCLEDNNLPITIDPTSKVATIPSEELTIDQVNRLQAAEQLADIYIVKSGSSRE